MRFKKHRKWAVAAAVVATIGIVGATYSPSTVPSPSNAQCHSTNGLPDLRCTPGQPDPRVTQANIGSTICVKGYTATVRPPVSVTGPEKIVSQQQYGYASSVKGEYDHLIPLELGGSSSTQNLWFEAGTIPNAKDKVENKLRAEVCAGTITLQTAQSEIVNDWQTAK